MRNTRAAVSEKTAVDKKKFKNFLKTFLSAKKWLVHRVYNEIVDRRCSL